ncbi:MAG: hypothetical protein MJK04_16485 [Psychrosphaera sp.]|nr:hypothetical protein [Psychrosphaera sp.]
MITHTGLKSIVLVFTQSKWFQSATAKLLLWQLVEQSAWMQEGALLAAPVE